MSLLTLKVALSYRNGVTVEYPCLMKKDSFMVNTENGVRNTASLMVHAVWS